jgi:gliding motility-associated-like protein
MQPTFAGLQEGVAFRMSKDLSKLRWSTFIGGKECDAAFGIQFDLKGNVYICGGTSSQNIFPDPKMYQDSITYSNGFHYDSVDAFVCHLTGDSGKFINGTYLGGNSFDQAFFVQVDTGGNVYLYGQTLSSKSGTFPIVNPRYQDKHSGQFISIFNPQLDKLIRSTVFGKGDSIPDISPSAFLVDNCGKVYISGWGGEVNQPQYGGHGGTTTGLRYTADAFQKSTDGSDFYIAVFAPMMDTLLYATFFGNSHAAEHVDGGTSRFDKHAVVYQSVCGSCDYTTDPNPDPITTPGAHSRINKGKRNGSNSPGCNNLVLKLDVRIPDIIAQFSAPQLVCKGDTTPAIVRFTNLSKRATAYQWSFGDGSTSSGAELEHTFYDTGTYKVTLVAINPNSCSLTDTFSQFVKVVKHSSASFTIKSQACDGTVTLEATGAAAQYNWNFGDGTYKKGKIVSHTFTSDGTYLVRLYADSGTLCVDSSKAPIFISFTTASFSYMIDTCSGAVTFKNNSNGGVFYTWDFGDNTYDTVLNPVHVYKTKTSFKVTLTVTDNRNCIVTHSDSVRIKNGLVANFGFVQDSCSGRAAFTNYSKFARKYLWDFGDGTTDTSKNPIHFFTHDTLYTIRLVATASGGCSDTTEHKLNGVLSPVAKFTFRKDSCTSDVTFKSESFRGYRYDWIFGDGSDIVHATNPTHTYDKKGTYTAALIINSGSACTDTFTQKITVTNNKPSPVIIPNVFTPNDDGKNDRFIVEGNTVCIELEIEIYNRWGQLVFKQKGNPLTWDGHSIQGHELPAGVYYYIFRDPNFGERHGTVTLLRE